ncbi:unnamed protein product [Symbiodinium sp. CCMP2592]|nr:unnamed protein product [Symbiodinium sp. CCMP2592]
MGSVCCGARERLQEEQQECQRREERPARPEALLTKEEAMAQLLAERPQPKTMEEAMAEALEVTRLLQAMNGKIPEEEPAGLYEAGDIVIMGQGEYRMDYAVVTEAQVEEKHLTVMVLKDDRRTVAAQSWPYKSDVTLESRAGRLGKKVAISQWNCGKWRSCTSAVLQIGGSRVGHAGRRGQVALDARHKEFPLFVQRGKDVELMVNVEFSASEPGAETRFERLHEDDPMRRLCALVLAILQTAAQLMRLCQSGIVQSEMAESPGLTFLVPFDFQSGQHQMPHRRRMLKQTRCSARSCVVMGSVCCGARQRLQEEQQECQRWEERPARPEALLTKEEAMAQLLAERPQPKTMEEAMAEAFDAIAAGDIVIMGQGEYRMDYAVVTEAQVEEKHLTVMVLKDDRRTVAAQSWPYKSDVTLESRAGRLGKKVAISQWNCGKWRSCTSAVLQIGGSRVGHAGRRGQVALDARRKEFPLFVQRGKDVELVVNVEFSSSESVHFAVEDLVELPAQSLAAVLCEAAGRAQHMFKDGQHQMPHRRRMLKQTRCSARSCVVMGSVCCGARERLQEEQQECQRREERPARPEALLTKEEAMAQLLAERPQPKTMEEAMAEALEVTRLLQAMNGKIPEEEEPAGLYEAGDIVIMGQGEYRMDYAVVTEVEEKHLTVMVLKDDRRTVAAQSWPYKSDVTLESRAGRLGKKVAISQWNCGKHAGRRGQVALDARHKEFPLFVQRGKDVELVVNVEFSASESVHFAVEDLVELPAQSLAAVLCEAAGRAQHMFKDGAKGSGV